MKFALIMGASGDIGKKIAQELAEKGWSLYLHYHSNIKSAEEQLQEYQEHYPKQDFYALSLDMTQEEGIPLFPEIYFSIRCCDICKRLYDVSIVNRSLYCGYGSYVGSTC